MGNIHDQKINHGRSLVKPNLNRLTSLLTLVLISFIPHTSIPLLEIEVPIHMNRVVLVPHGLATGDLIFRNTDTFAGQFVNSVDTKSDYSHVGIIWVSVENKVFVIHATPHEEQTQNMVQATPLDEFLSYALDIAVYRPRSAYHQASIQAAEYAFSLAGTIPFDGRFDLKTEDSVYCTELIWRGFLQAGVDIVDNHFEELELPLFGVKDYILPSTLINEKYFYQFYP